MLNVSIIFQDDAKFIFTDLV